MITPASFISQYGFNPGAEHDRKIAAAKDKKASAGADDVHKQSLFRKATDLFERVPVLKALFIEILASQGVSTILNVAYVTKLSSVIPDDKERAGWSGKVSKTILPTIPNPNILWTRELILHLTDACIFF